MSELANTTSGGIALLDQLAEEARMCVRNVERNLYHLGRVLIEAKRLCRHGEWLGWLDANAGGMSTSKADSLMAATLRFEGKPEFEGIGQTSLFKMLALPEGTEEAFVAEHDVKAMTTREVAEAVKKVRAEAQAAIDEAEAARRAAEARAEELAARPPEIPEEIKGRLADQKAEIERLRETASDAVEDARKLREEKIQLERDAEEWEQDLAAQQAELDRTKDELSAMKSAQARGEAARPSSGDVTYDALNCAVREFMGAAARVPYMHTTFGGMAQAEKQRYAVLVNMIEDWARGARQALESITVEGVTIDEG